MAKGGGSQLAQLRSKLQSAGVTDRRQQSKKSKQRKGGVDEKDAAVARRNKISAITSSLNPFEEKITKPKHNVLGRKIKGAVGRPGAAKDSGLAQRKASLLPEWQARNKSGTFVDRRFGENDANLTPEERMLERFTAEKQRKSSKGAMYNLNDGEDEGLTHYGQSLSGFDDLADIGLPDDQDESMDDRNNFGGFGEEQDDDPDRVKTKTEVMREVMAKSKLHKIERQKMRDEDDELRQQLDNDLGDIRDLLMSTAAPEAKEEQPAHQDKEKADDATQQDDGKRPLINSKVESNTYDSFVKELAFERRAKPQDRLKSEAEMAAEEAKRLMKAEKARLKRMRGDSDDEGDDEEEGSSKRRRKGDKSNKKRSAQADDLDDDFQLDGMTAGEAYGLGPGLKVAGETDETDEEDEEGEEEEDGGEEEDDDEDGEDDFADLADVDVLAVPGEDEDLEEEGDQEALVGSGSGSKKVGKKSNKALTKEEISKLPFTFPCPSTHEEFLNIMEEHNIEPKYIPTVVKRIRTLYHASLNEDNKHKLQAFIGVLLDHALHSAALASTDGTNRVHFAVVNTLIPHIFTISQTYPTAAAHHFVSKLALMQRNLSRGLAKGALSPDARTWPTLPELTLLRIAGTVWPTSDRYHAVTTPLAILMAQYLGHARIRSLSDLASGLFLCSLVVSHERDSRRLFPEATNFLYSCIAILAPIQEAGKKGSAKEAEAYGIPTPDVSASHTASLSLTSETGVKEAKINAGPVNLIDLLNMSSTATGLSAATIKAQLLSLALELLGEFGNLYKDSTSTVELFTPYVQLLSAIDSGSLPASVSSRVEDTHTSLDRQVRMASSSRRHLRLQAHRAIAIQSYVPKFDQQGFNPERKGDFDPDTERTQISKMRALIKKERKGAVRELRKDNQFIAEERRKEQAEEDQRYKKKIDKIMSTLQDERSEQKQMDRQKARLKKRAGGKK